MTFDDILESKLARIGVGINKWRTSKDNGSYENGIGTMVYPTGFGKTIAGIEIINLIHSKNPNADIVILTPTDRVKKQWRGAVNNKAVTVITPNEQTGLKQPYLLIIDELHDFTSDNRVELINSFKFKFALALTATYYEDLNVERVFGRKFPVIDCIKLTEALERGWISNFTEYNLGISLSVDAYKKYKDYTDYMTTISDKYGGFDNIMSCMYGDKNNKSITPIMIRERVAKSHGWDRDNYNEDINADWSPGAIAHEVFNYKTIMDKRLDFINNHPDKLTLTIAAINKLHDRKIITFSQSQQFVNSLVDAMPDIVLPYHAGIKQLNLPDSTQGLFGKEVVYRDYKGVKLKDKIIELIDNENYTYRVISTVKALNQGFNLDALSAAISVAGDCNPIKYKQQMGRTLRIDKYNPNKHSIILNLYLRGTRDEQKLKARQFRNGNNVYYIDSLDELPST